MDETALPLTEHLTELRSRLFKIVIAWAIGFAGAWNFSEVIFGFLLEPATSSLGEGGQLQAIAPTEIFFTYLKCALLAGFVFALPVIFWQLWAFIAPGLYPSEKKVALPFVICSTFLFIAGGTFGYYIVFPLVFEFFAGFSNDFVQSAWTMREVFALTTRLLLAFGAGFELPVLVFFLSAAGIMDPSQFLGGMKYAVISSFIFAAVLTPPDVISQILLAVPLIFLYVLGVGVAYLFAPRPDKGED